VALLAGTSGHKSWVLYTPENLIGMYSPRLIHSISLGPSFAALLMPVLNISLVGQLEYLVRIIWNNALKFFSSFCRIGVTVNPKPYTSFWFSCGSCLNR
jgi:hypothetical protein